MKKTATSSYVVIPESTEQQKKNPEILRVVLNCDFTRIDFGYAAPFIYEKGGWIRIAPYSFIVVQGSKQRYRLKDTWNIPVAPEVFKFESIKDWKIFSLYFEPIPVRSCKIDIIEEEEPNKNDFNYYNVVLDDVNGYEIMD